MKKKINILICGAQGRVGKELVTLLGTDTRVDQVFLLDRSYGVNKRQNEFVNISDLKSFSIDLIIDFSSPELLSRVVDFATGKKIPLVSGTTGLAKKDFAKLKRASAKIPVLWAANMSLGIAVLNRALLAFSAIREFDYQIEEFHHNKKVDNPGGTALALQAQLEKVLRKKLPKAIGIRGGGIFGVHKVYAMSEDEVLCFKHTALTRRVFAQGAIKAANWLLSKKPGLYEIEDVVL